MTDQDVVHTGPYVASVAAKRHVRLVLRPEHNEWDLIEQHPQLLDAVLLPESYVAPYPSGHPLVHASRLRVAVNSARKSGSHHVSSAWPTSRSLCWAPVSIFIHSSAA